MSSEGVRANILVKKPSFGVGNEELLDISFKQFWEHEFQESRPVVCFTDSQLKARDERIARKFQEAIKIAITLEPEMPGQMPDEMWEAMNGDRDASEEVMRISVRLTKKGILERFESHINSEEFRKV